MKILQRLTITKLASDQDNIKYHIDFPKTGSHYDSSNLYIGFSGWIHSLDETPVNFVFSHMPDATFTSNRDRHDVKKYFPSAPLSCGYRYALDYNAEFKIGAKVDGKTYWLTQVKISTPKAMALRGSQGHLFLSNDTNDSINQFTGKTLISERELEKWGRYFDKLNSWSSRSGTPFTFMIAPAKEYIYPEHYPEKKGSITPLEQFSLYFSKRANLLNPEVELTKDKEFSYFKTDSHWNDYGASVAAAAFCSAAGFIYEPPFIEYVIKPFAGDLATKLTPIIKENSLLVSNKESLLKHKIFDSNIAARGNIVIYENPDAANNTCLMLFGDSFSTSMGDFLSHSFSRVVRIFSGADIDWPALEYECPDYVLIELASRFLIRAPSDSFSISDEIRRKYLSMDSPTLEKHVQKLQSGSGSSSDYYASLFRDTMNSIAELNIKT